jgi:hypothetical protein
MLRRVALVRTDVSEELSASFIRVTRIGELGSLAVTSNRRTLRRNTKRQFSQEPQSVTSQKAPFFIVTTVKTSNRTISKIVIIMFNVNTQSLDIFRLGSRYFNISSKFEHKYIITTEFRNVIIKISKGNNTKYSTQNKSGVSL